jgi:hypothetical protein
MQVGERREGEQEQYLLAELHARKFESRASYLKGQLIAEEVSDT